MSAENATQADPLELVGTLIDDRYRVERLIGRGGMGYVYAAEHTRIQRSVAIKVLSQLQARRRFEREALATARIDHPNSVRLSDFGHLEDGTLFLVMELLVGESLAAVVDRGPLAPLRAATICRDILRALAHAHEQGVVHRDIKPENIFLCESEQGEMAKVLDFGIAKLISDATAGDSEERLTEAGMAIGTPTYMSPEQGFGSGIDGRSDLYSTSILLFEMLTGEPPFRADSPLETLQMHISAPPPTLASKVRDAAALAPFESLIAAGLAKKSGERVATANEYIDRLDAIIAALSGPISAHAMTPAPLAAVALGEPVPVGFGPTAALPLAVSAPTAPLRPPIAKPATRPLPRRRWPLWSLLGMIAVFVVIGFASTSDESDSATAAVIDWLPIEAVASAPAPSPRALEAAALLADERAKDAVTLLADDPGAADDATAQLALGHAHHALSKSTNALAAYERALALDLSTGADTALLANLETYLSSRRTRTVEAALAVLVAVAAKPQNREGRRVLAQVASTHPKRSIRAAAQVSAAGLDIGGLDELAMYTLDLKQGSTCKDRLEAIGHLRELGDKRAIDALKSAQRRMRGGLLGIGAKNSNHCLAEAAREAVAELEAR